jgi:hypothetical protein
MPKTICSTFYRGVIVLLAINVMQCIQCSYFIIDPLSNTTWSTGQAVTVRWRIRGAASTNPKIAVELIAGPANNGRWVDTICDNISSLSSDCSWTVPDYLPTMPSGYSVRINYMNGPNPNFDYSPRFQIKGASMGNDDQPPIRPAPSACITCNVPPGTDLSKFTEVRDPNSSASSYAGSAKQNLITLCLAMLTYLNSI